MSKRSAEYELELADGKYTVYFLAARVQSLEETLQEFLNEYVALVNFGDAGNWDPEVEKKVIDARAILKSKGKVIS